MTDAGPVARAAELAALGHRAPSTPPTVDRLRRARSTDDADPRVRAAALGALVRAAPDDAVDPWRARASPTPPPRCAVAPPSSRPRSATRHARRAPLLALLDDPDVTVVEAAAWALGELGDARGRRRRGRRARARSRASTATRWRAKPRSRRSARSVTATRCPRSSHACHDKPAVRRRAVLALAPFDGPEVDAAIDGRARRPRLAGATGRRGPPRRLTPTQLDVGRSSIGSTNSSWSRLTCSVHSWPVQ